MAKRHRVSAVQQSRFMEIDEVQKALEAVSKPTEEESPKPETAKVKVPKKESAKPAEPANETKTKKQRKKSAPKAAASDQLFSLTDAKAIKDEPQLTNKGRKKFTTMIRPELKELLLRIAKNKGLTIPDVVEGVLLDYFNMSEEELSKFSK
ncbi:hypothetical protein CRP01_04525 [Flavilitoribacter nigricans DSM 23189 = NBRC 102662]|uniref:Uncharacterized protein n=2 Tax=Flavilitoribacter TaxID=2762562 RepID=A0A2D0NHC5_FLAN2|nr:hypothetical protein CRP01_04525 [Flavilitoribacter nigricans DSM 23189 = NBRC 102662]